MANATASGSQTSRLIRAYNQQAAPTRFLSGMFQSPAENFHNSEEVQIDIERGEENISIVVTDLSQGYRKNATDIYTSKGFVAPIHKEEVALNSFDLLKRMVGQDPFEDPNFRGNMITRMFSGMRRVEAKIRRAIELQASQVLQTGIITLTNETGAALYELDYKAKATHFPTSGIAWGTAGADIQGDIEALSEVIRNDGLGDPDELIMGVDAYQAFINDPIIQPLFDNRRMVVGGITPATRRGNGGTFRGTIDIGNYSYDMFTYGGRFIDPVTGFKEQYLDPAKVIIRDSSGRLDATFGAIPNIGRLLGVQANQLISELPSRISNTDGGIDLFTNMWLSNDGEQIFGGVGTRPLLIPTAIDTYGCLDTLAT